MLELREESCYPMSLMGVNVGLASVDAVIALLAFAQLMRIHSRNTHNGWTRQKIRGVYVQFLVQAQSVDDPKNDGDFTSVITMILSSVPVRVIVVIVLWC